MSSISIHYGNNPYPININPRIKDAYAHFGRSLFKIKRNLEYSSHIENFTSKREGFLNSASLKDFPKIKSFYE